MLDYSENNYLVHAGSAIAAGLITATMTNPIWVIKTRLQLNKSAPAKEATRWYGSSLKYAQKIIHTEGFSGFYRDLSASYLSSFETAVYLVIYKQLKSRFAWVLKISNSENPAFGKVKY